MNITTRVPLYNTASSISRLRASLGADTFNLKYDAENRLVEVKKNNVVVATFTPSTGSGQASTRTENG